VLIYAIISGNDGDAFAVLPDGNITVARPLDFETTNSYTLEMQIADGELDDLGSQSGSSGSGGGASSDTGQPDTGESGDNGDVSGGGDGEADGVGGGTSSARNVTCTYTVQVQDANDPPQFPACPSASNADIDYVPYPGFSSVQGLVNSQTDADGVNVFLLSGETGFGDDEARCLRACSALDTCEAYTLFGNSYFVQGLRGSCFGRSAFTSVMAPIDRAAARQDSNANVSAQASAVTYTLFSGRKVRSCELITLRENLPGSTWISAPFAIADFEGDPFSVRVAAAGRDTDQAGMFTIVNIT